MTRRSRSVCAVILAGGAGQRFWPLSRELSPKQMLDVFGTESLVVQAIRRVQPLLEADRGHVFVVTGERLFDELRNHLSAQEGIRTDAVNYIVEPRARNTAPAIALAAAKIAADDPEAVMVVLPSDHMIENGAAWIDTLRCGVELAAGGYLVTVGVTPTRPETGYGYILAGEGLPDYDLGVARPRTALRFVEKPDETRAMQYLAEGGYLWNAGIFVMRASRLLEELRLSGNEGIRIADACEWVAARLDDSASADEARVRFEALPSVSVDKAVMEHAERVAVVPASFEWSDVGSLLALQDTVTPDASGNVRTGRGVDIDSTGNIVYATDGPVATLGVHDLIVIGTSDAALVCAKNRAQDVRMVVDALKAQGAEEVVRPRTSLRPWGSWTTLLRGEGFEIKLLEVAPGKKLSLQRHHRRTEHWVVVSGTASVTRGDETFEVCTDQSTFIPVGAVHRLENGGTHPLKVIEVQVGDYLGEDDIIRLDDDWSRQSR